MNSNLSSGLARLLWLPALATACSDSDTTWVGATDPRNDSPGVLSGLPLDDRFPTEGAERSFVPAEFLASHQDLSARLRVEGEDLVLNVRNLTNTAGVLDAHALVENEDALFFTDDVGRAEFGPREELDLRLPRAAVNGLDLLRHEWTDARISFAYELEDGRQGGDYAFVLTHKGQMVPAINAVSSGITHGLPEPEAAQEELVAKQAATFRVCFEHVISFAAADSNPIDHFRAAGAHTVRASGLHIGAVTPNSGVATVYLDLNGCANLQRTAGTWSFNVFVKSVHWPIEGTLITAMRSDGTIPMKQVGPFTVTALTTSLPTQRITMPSGTDSDLQTAFVMAQHTIKRGMSLGTIVNPDKASLILKLLPSGWPEKSGYDHPTRTIELHAGDARGRAVTAHETGHWIHRSWSAAPSKNTYCTPGGDPSCTVPPTDGCTRSTTSNGSDHIEWQSTAHAEGIAEFFSFLAYNNTTGPGSNCFAPSIIAGAPERFRNCESVGMTMKTGGTGGRSCFEWTDPMFTKVGVSLDWAKMYWDLFADETGLGNTRLRDYLLTEQRITGWTHINHIEELLKATNGTAMNAAIRRSATGNIWDGLQH